MVIPTGLELPLPDPHFVNRQLEMDELLEAYTGKSGAVVTISGVAGIGKSELVWRLAKRLRSQFPDGQMAISLNHEETAPEHAVRQVLATVIHVFDPYFLLVDDLTTLQTHYLALLADKQFLLIVDQVVDDSAIRFLQPPAANTLVLISREQIHLQNSFALHVDPLSADSAEQLLLALCARIGRDAPILAEQCQYMPLALRLSAALLAQDDTKVVKQYIEHLAAVEATARLDYIIQRSFESIDSAYQQLLCQISMLADGVSQPTLKAILNHDGGDAWLIDGLNSLRRRNLLMFDAETMLYRMPNAIRRLARTQLQLKSEINWRLGQYHQQVAADIVYYANRSSDGLIVSLRLFDDYKANFKRVLSWLQQQDESQTEVASLIVDLCRVVLVIGRLRFFPTLEQRPFLHRARQAAQQTGEMNILTAINNKLAELTI